MEDEPFLIVDVVHEVNELVVLANALVVISDSLLLVGVAFIRLAQMHVVRPETVLLRPAGRL